MDDPDESSKRVMGTASRPGSARRAGAGDAVDLCLLDPDNLLSPGARAWLETHADAALAFLGLTGELRVRLLDDEAMGAAHERFSGIPGPTDVLTFDLNRTPTGLPAPEWARTLDADLLLGVGEAERQARDHGFTTERELLLYLVHGVLHCLGHDDHDPQAAGAMHREEDRVLSAIGVGATFAPGAGAGREGGGS